MVDFEMPSDDPGAEVKLKRVVVNQQHCILGPVPAGKNCHLKPQTQTQVE